MASSGFSSDSDAHGRTLFSLLATMGSLAVACKRLMALCQMERIQYGCWVFCHLTAGRVKAYNPTMFTQYHRQAGVIELIQQMCVCKEVDIKGCHAGSPRSSIRREASRGQLQQDPQGRRLLERSLREFVRIKTVSRDPELKEDCFRGAKYLSNKLEALGELTCMACCISTLVLHGIPYTFYDHPLMFISACNDVKLCDTGKQGQTPACLFCQSKVSA